MILSSYVSKFKMKWCAISLESTGPSVFVVMILFDVWDPISIFQKQFPRLQTWMGRVSSMKEEMKFRDRKDISKCGNRIVKISGLKSLLHGKSRDVVYKFFSKPRPLGKKGSLIKDDCLSVTTRSISSKRHFDKERRDF